MDLPKLEAFRKLLHRYPELSTQEEKTAQRVAGFLESCPPDVLITGLGGHGVAAVYGTDTQRTVMIRGDMDALPIQEISTIGHRSQVDGVSHMCGHDGHTTILLGLAQVLHDQPPKGGRIVLLFQPAEENGAGAAAVLSDEKFAQIEPNFVLALHNLPGYPMHAIVSREGTFNAAVRSIIIELHGKTSHAGEPDLGQNPALAIAEILQSVDAMQRPIDQEDFAQCTPVYIEMGEKAYGVSAGYGEVHLTLRCWDNAHIDAFADQVEAKVVAIGKQHQLEPRISWTEVFASCENDPAVVDVIQRTAIELGLVYESKTQPFRWGEDFGLYTQRYPGAMFGLGAGENTPALHNPDYDFPDQITPSGIQVFYQTALSLLL